MRVASSGVCQQVLRGWMRAGIFAAAVLGGAVETRAQQMVTDAPVAKTGGTAYVGKFTSTSVFSAGPTFHFTAPVTITSVAYDPGPGGVQELGVRGFSGCTLNQVTSAGMVCAIDTAIASQYPGMRFGTLRVTTTSGVFTLPVGWQSIGALVAVTPGMLSAPQGTAGVVGNALAVDALGNLYLSGDNVVRRIDASTGAVRMIAGAVGTASIDGDGGSATAAHIGYPVDVVASPAGDTYLVSSAPNANDAVRKVDAATGIISTVTQFVTGRVPSAGNTGGNGTDGAIAVDDQGNIYASVTKTNSLTVTAGDGSGTKSLIGTASDRSACNGGGEYAPTTVAVSGGYVYFSSAAAIYKVSADTASCHTPTLIAGTGTSGNSGDGGLATKAAFGFVSGVAVDAAGNMYFADATNEVVRVVSSTTGLISTVAGAGSELPGVTVAPGWASLALDVRGNLYVLSAAGTVQKIDVSAGALSFADAALGQTARGGSKSVVFSNIGNDDLSAAASQPSLSSESFGWDSAMTTCGTGNASTLGAGAACVAGVRVNPTAAGSLQGMLELDGVHVTLTDTVAVSAPPVAKLSMISIDFGKISQGKSSATWTVDVSNTGGSPLNISSIVLNDTKNFVLGGNCGNAVAASGSCSLTVAFRPQTTGVVSGSISLTDNANPMVQTISLTGSGVKASYTVTVNPGTLTVEQGHSGSAQFVFMPVGGFDGAVNFACSGLPEGATCSFAPAALKADGSDRQQASTLTVSTRGAANPTTANMVSGKGITLASLLGFNGMLLLGLRMRRKRMPSTKLMGVLLLLAMSMAGVTGCGSGGSLGWFTPAGTSTVSVVTTSAVDGSSQTATFVLTVK